MDKSMQCKMFEKAMPDLLFDRAMAPSTALAHLACCIDCQAELAAMERTMQVLDGWKTEAAEPSPFWTARMGARLREEQARPALGWARMRQGLRTRLWVSNHTLRPAGVAALGLLLAVCGGTWINLATQNPAPVQASNTVRDLQSLNQNAQVFQALAALDGPDTSAQSSN